MRFYEVVAKHGHVGTRRYQPIRFAICAENLLAAVDRAQQMPGVKHTQTVLSAKEITFQEYCLRRQKSAYEQFKYKEEQKR